MAHKTVLVYQVYDETDPQATDSYFDRIDDARKASYRFHTPSKIYTRKIPLTRAGLCHALKTYPMR